MVTVVVDGVVTSSYRYTTLEDVTEGSSGTVAFAGPHPIAIATRPAMNTGAAFDFFIIKYLPSCCVVELFLTKYL